LCSPTADHGQAKLANYDEVKTYVADGQHFAVLTAFPRNCSLVIQDGLRHDPRYWEEEIQAFMKAQFPEAAAVWHYKDDCRFHKGSKYSLDFVKDFDNSECHGLWVCFAGVSIEQDNNDTECMYIAARNIWDRVYPDGEFPLIKFDETRKKFCDHFGQLLEKYADDVQFYRRTAATKRRKTIATSALASLPIVSDRARAIKDAIANQSPGRGYGRGKDTDSFYDLSTGSGKGKGRGKDTDSFDDLPTESGKGKGRGKDTDSFDDLPTESGKGKDITETIVCIESDSEEEKSD
jgi:hypothetical protein